MTTSSPRRLLTIEAALGAARLHGQHPVDGRERAGGEALIVVLVSTGGACKHDVVAVLPPGHARLV